MKASKAQIKIIKQQEQIISLLHIIFEATGLDKEKLEGVASVGERIAPTKRPQRTAAEVAEEQAAIEQAAAELKDKAQSKREAKRVAKAAKKDKDPRKSKDPRAVKVQEDEVGDDKPADPSEFASHIPDEAPEEDEAPAPSDADFAEGDSAGSEEDDGWGDSDAPNPLPDIK